MADFLIPRADCADAKFSTGIEIRLHLDLYSLDGYTEARSPHGYSHRQAARQCAAAEHAWGRSRVVAAGLCGQIRG